MFEKIAKLIETRLADNYTTTPVRFRNVPFRQPTTGEWVAANILGGDGRQDSIGATKLERQLGNLIFQVFTPKNTGDRRAKAIADVLSNLFRYQTLNEGGVNVIFRAPQVGDVGERADSYQINVNIPYQAESLFS